MGKAPLGDLLKDRRSPTPAKTPAWRRKAIPGHRWPGFRAEVGGEAERSNCCLHIPPGAEWDASSAHPHWIRQDTIEQGDLALVLTGDGWWWLLFWPWAPLQLPPPGAWGPRAVLFRQWGPGWLPNWTWSEGKCRPACPHPLYTLPHRLLQPLPIPGKWFWGCDSERFIILQSVLGDRCAG